MNIKCFFLFLAVFSSKLLYSQCEDCFTENDWKIATGVTLASNMIYSPSLQIRQPLELSLRYKIHKKHVLRLGIPMAWKTKVYGSPVYPDYPLSEIAPEEYVQYMQNLSEYSFFTKSLDYYYTIYGFSLGYSHDLLIAKSLNIFGGLDLAYNHQFAYKKYYKVGYKELDENYQNTLILCTINDYRTYLDCYSIKPLIGFRYQFQKLLIEGNIGYNILRYTYLIERKSNGWYSPGIIVNDPDSRYTTIHDYNKLAYNISLFYAF